MQDVKIDETSVKKAGNKYLFDSRYTSELDEEEYKNIITKLENQIKRCKSIIVENNPEKAVEKEIEAMKNQLKVNKEALKNYDKFYQEEVDKMIKDKDKLKIQLKTEIDNHLKIKELRINKLRASKQAYIDSFKFQQEKDEKMLRLYRDLEVQDEK